MAEMEIITIGGHSFNPLLFGNGVIIDVGCRGFVFTDHFADKTIYAIDPDPKVFEGYKGNANCLNVAISDKLGFSAYYENGEATCLKEIDPDQSHPFKPCQTITMDELYKITGENVDLLKLDCEGAEYIILGEGFKPIPKQISVEFHFHTVPETHNKHFPAIMERLKKDYEVFSGQNLWDMLFLRKDLLE